MKHWLWANFLGRQFHEFWLGEKMFTLVKMISNKFRKTYMNLLSSYMNEKYKNWYFCEASIEDGKIVFSVAKTKTSYSITATNNPSSLCIVVRSRVGSHMLMINGLRKPEEIPVVRLVSRLSFIRAFGIVGWLLFKKEWKGNSFINLTLNTGPVVAVKYL